MLWGLLAVILSMCYCQGFEIMEYYQEVRVPFSMSSSRKISCKSIYTPGNLYQLEVEIETDAQSEYEVEYTPLCAYIEGSTLSLEDKLCFLFCQDLNVQRFQQCDDITIIAPIWSSQRDHTVKAVMTPPVVYHFSELQLCVFMTPSAVGMDGLGRGLVRLAYDMPLLEESSLVSSFQSIYSDHLIVDVAIPTPPEHVTLLSPPSPTLRGMLPLAVHSTGALFVQVNNATDFLGVAAHCDPGTDTSAPPGTCNLRSAVAYCFATGAMTAANACTIYLPASFNVIMEESLGSIDVSDATGHVNIHIQGADSTLTARCRGRAGLFNLTSFADRMSVSMENMTIQGFGVFNSQTVSAVHLNGVQSAVFTSIVFQHNTGYNGGSVFMTRSSHISFVNCTFFNSSADDGGAVHIQHSQLISFSGCLFLSNYAHSCGGGLYTTDVLALTMSDCILRRHDSYYGGSVMYASVGFDDALFDRVLVADNLQSAFDGRYGYLPT